MSTPAVAPLPASQAEIARTYDPHGPYLRLRVQTTAPDQVIDITEQLEAFLVLTGLRTGLLAVHTQHTTTAVVVNEQEPLLHEDLFARLDRLAPRNAAYAHDDPDRRIVNRVDPERTNGHAHCRALLLGNSTCVPIMGGRLQLGRWQRVLLVECDGPQERGVVATIVGGTR